MSLTPGARFGPYEIAATIGAGGMGEVFRARDTKLNRDVAIKVLPAAFAQDADRVARFRREAHVLASLNHPNIAAIHGLEESDRVVALALELVEGEDLAERLKRGVIPVEEAIAIAKQIALGLEAAHERGVVHRDLKPANIKVTPGGDVKLLDFGLAKAIEGEPAAEADVAQSPTLSRRMTEAGLVLGTAAYMSPEQARGKPVDKRADIWSFGVVLYEMLAGRRLFAGETVSDTLAAVLKTDPDWSALPGETPDPVRRLLRRCLERDPRRRLRDIGDAALELDEDVAEAGQAPPTGVPRWSLALAWTIAIAATAAAAVSLGRAARSRPNPPRPLRLSVELSPDAPLDLGLGHRIALSPDGSRLAFVGNASGERFLFIRALDQPAAIKVAGTAGATQPFFSANGGSIGFFRGDDLWRVPAEGGVPSVVCKAGPDARGATWGPDDTIVFVAAQNQGLHRVRAAGGTPEPLTRLLAGERSHRWPSFLPGGRRLLFNVQPGNVSFDEARVELLDLESGKRQLVFAGGAEPRYADGRVLFVRGGKLYAAPYDERAARLSDPAVVVHGVESDARNGGSQFAVSSEGTLAYLAGTGSGTEGGLTWVDRDGRTAAFLDRPDRYLTPRFSPAGDRVAMQIGKIGFEDIWTADVRTASLTRLTFEEISETSPVWSPDGSSIAYESGSRGRGLVVVKRADGSGAPQTVYEAGPGLDAYPTSWSPDGRTLLFRQAGPTSAYDLWALDLASGKATVYVRSPANDGPASFSPDGRHVAYASEESGTSQVYVRTYPDTGGRWQVSTEGGNEPVWRRDGREIVFRVLNSPLDEWQAVPVEATSATFRAGPPRLLFRGEFGGNPLFPSWDVSPDGKRVLVVQQRAGAMASATHVELLFQWARQHGAGAASP